MYYTKKLTFRCVEPFTQICNPSDRLIELSFSFQGIGKENLLLVVATPTTASQSEQVKCYVCDCNGPISLQPVEQLTCSVEDYLLNNTQLLRVQSSFSLYLATGDRGTHKPSFFSPLKFCRS